MSRAYPPPPWHLCGHGVQILQLVDVRSVRPLIPPELSIVQVLPNRTVGIVAFAHYGPGSILEYDELIIASALVRAGGSVGVWISHIYVNHPVSVQGGREIWGVPKEMADFEWNETTDAGSAAAYLNGELIARVTVNRRWWLMKKKLKFPTFSQRGGELIRFVGDMYGRIGWGRGQVEIPPSAPFGNLNWGKPLVSLWVDEMQLICREPRTVGATTFAAGADRWLAQPAMLSVEDSG